MEIQYRENEECEFCGGESKYTIKEREYRVGTIICKPCLCELAGKILEVLLNDGR